MERVSWPDIRAALRSRPPQRVVEPVTAHAAVAVVLREGRASIEILFIRRAEHPADPWSGQMAFPGGRAEPGDADLRATALRETREEVGLDLEAQAEHLGALDEVRAMARMRPLDLAISPFVFRLQGDAVPVLSPEVCSVHWLPLDDLLGPTRHSTLDYEHQGDTLRFPCLRVEELVIWGLTYRMFMSFQERVRPATPGAPAGALP
ncbi:MAG TPA: CoA pyrophosphatase [Vicinamibacteria bacterium]|nr:CoA pyrophosphatase [Vicinamibacteria bacterium]